MSRQTRVRFLIFSYVIILICSFQSPYQSQTSCSIMPRVASWLVTKAILFDLVEISMPPWLLKLQKKMEPFIYHFNVCSYLFWPVELIKILCSFDFWKKTKFYGFCFWILTCKIQNEHLFFKIVLFVKSTADRSGCHMTHIGFKIRNKGGPWKPPLKMIKQNWLHFLVIWWSLF